MPLNAQLQNGLDEEIVENGWFPIDGGLLERNRLLAKFLVIVGPSKRFLHPCSLFEVGC